MKQLPLIGILVTALFTVSLSNPVFARTARVIGKPGAGKRSSISKPSEV